MNGSDYQSAGQEWMQKMMGDNYDSYKQEVTEMMGEDFFQKMQELMGKSYQSGKGYMNMMMPMMSGFTSAYNQNALKGWGGMMSGWGGSFWGWIAGFLMILLGIALVGIPLGVFVLLVLLIVKLVKSLK
ncbi:hypothetical protein A2108_01685 [Candidatus Wolfebacteria bacterium GWA1_42_9]|nr:MAG: hypothetical protein A2108_01685 [Candidatus Wolfebacteria bacterium GWA1_42_9]